VAFLALHVLASDVFSGNDSPARWMVVDSALLYLKNDGCAENVLSGG
jgi:hypothetical protein